MAMTIAGIVWVIGERRPEFQSIPRRKIARGVLLALLAAFCQSGGYFLSKLGMGHGLAGASVEPQTATLIRMIFAAMTILPVLAVHIWLRGSKRRPTAANVVAIELADSTEGRISTSEWRLGIFLSLCGAVAGPYLGVWLSLIACDKAPLGVAQTLLTLSPVFILPATAIIHRERISLRAAFGALLAVGGAAMLFAAGPST